MVDSGTWRVVVPVKGGGDAKTRLALPPGPRLALATAMALDCVDAALRCAAVGRVLCVSDDEAVRAAAGELGARAVPAGGPGLARAVDAGLAALPTGPTAVLVADLPALRPEDLGAALAEAEHHRGPVLVADADGDGSVLVARRDGPPPHRFGPGSAAAHRAAGARELTAPLPGLRRDVDTLDALRRAAALGVGPRTAAALGRTALSASCTP
ncbi:2-phospho-L-lactate guanylyltransferase [Paenibacillus sp. TRM 82003]|uniref:2-phospho-L-lactate guanylyltransferase n=1 Tax=Kineococcus sp. TRM81007 TaxID=2925831 RepID=UPI001F56F2F3|nr:2-phospho-L-lactate guanylyltransferase [Kineococcus sp. TRM81007]MCI2239909.1 2-phospho-L-lactate guanylyltransferase [Kineococcus sp. TRM81007]MCI3925787.1 2-phospho-L-lactate guanylyltransferase [Paenibacillus sp. TRM 82003]